MYSAEQVQEFIGNFKYNLSDTLVKKNHHRFPMKFGMLLLQDKEILKT